MCVLISSSNLIWTNNLLLFNPNNTNHPNLEVSVAFFSDNYEPLELKIANSILKINNEDSKIDSTLLLNSTVKLPINLTIVLELSSAINSDDLDFYKSVYKHFTQISKSIYNDVSFIFIADKPIYLRNLSEVIYMLDSLKYLKFYHKTDLNKLLNSQFFMDRQPSVNSLLLITKSQPKLNADNFVNYINSKQIKYNHINLSNHKYPIIDEICRRTNSISVNKNDFNKEDDLLKLSSYILTSGPYLRLYSSKGLMIDYNFINLKSGNDEGSTMLRLYENDFPNIDISEPVYFYGVLDSGVKRTKILKLAVSNRPILITNIISDNPNFKIANFQNNIKLQPNETYDLKVDFTSKSLNFDSAVVTIFTNTNKEYKIYLYAGKVKSFTNNDLKFLNIEDNLSVFGSNSFRFHWTGSHPLDTFLLEYKLLGEQNWRLISNKSSGNKHNWIVPDIPDTSIKIRLSKQNNKLISDKVLLLEEHKRKISEVSFSPNDSLIATAGEDGFIILWNSKTGKKLKTLFQSQSKTITSIDWSIDGQYLTIAALDTSIKIWSVESDVLFKDLTTTNKVISANFSYDGKFLIVRQIDNKVIIYDFISLQILSNFQIPFDITYFEVNPNNYYFLATSIDGNFIIYDYVLNKNVNLYPSTDFPILSGSFSPTGNNVVISGNDNKIRIYDIQTGQNVLTIFDSQSPVVSVNWLKNRQFIATSSGSLIKLWSPSDGKLIETYDQHSSAVYYLKSNKSGNLVASIDQNNIIHLWSPFDFPFIKPLSISIESPKINITQKKVQTNSYFISNIQVSDTLCYYFEDIAHNFTVKPIFIDGVTIATSTQVVFIDEKYSNFPLNPNDKIIVSMNYIPREIGLNQIDFNIKSGSKVFKSQVNANVQPNILDKKFLEINFGKVPLGKSKDTSVFMLQNISETPIRIDSIKFFNGTDFRLVSLDMPYIIRPIGGVFAPTLKFLPSIIEPQGGFFRVFFDRLLPIDVYFYGEGIAPKLDVVNEPTNVSNVCQNNILIPIVVKNSGNTFLEINSIQIDALIKDELEIMFFPALIAPAQIDTIWLRWNPIVIGKNNVSVTIKTNLQSNKFDETKVVFETDNNYYKFKINPNPVLFEPIDDNNHIQKVITIENIGSIMSDYVVDEQLKYFTLDSIQIINNSAFLYLSFLGGFGKEFYSDTLFIKDECGTIYKIELIALLKKNQALLSIQDSINFGVLICEQRIEKQLLIQNVGNSDLIISDISFDTQTTSLQVIPTILTIPPNSFSYITLIFQPSNKQILENYLILKSNAVNHQDGLTKIPIIGVKQEVAFSFDRDTIDFGLVALQEIIEKDLFFENTGTISLPNKFKNFNDIFSLIYSEETNIFPNTNKKITIRKNPTKITGLIIDSLLYTDPCGNAKSVILKIKNIDNPKYLNFSLPYPNPTYNDFSLPIISNYPYNLNYQVFDYLGKTIKKGELELINQNQYNLNISLNSYFPGVYLLKIWIDNTEYQFKIIKIN